MFDVVKHVHNHAYPSDQSELYALRKLVVQLQDDNQHLMTRNSSLMDRGIELEKFISKLRYNNYEREWYISDDIIAYHKLEELVNATRKAT